MNPSHQNPAGPNGNPLHAALLAYARHPGKYPAGLRQPAVLFTSVREIIQLAIGRGASAASDTDAGAIAVHRAACFFVKTALLYPGADHYALLGLDRKADDAALKDRYRLMMRLIHPDFSGAGSAHWPADAAVRVNQAYEVLSSAVRRRDYDASLARPPAPDRPIAVKPSHQRTSPPQRARAPGISRAGYSRLIAACGVAGALVLLSLFMSGRDGVHLVQRETVTAPAVVVAAKQAIAPSAPPIAAAPVEKSPPPMLVVPPPVVAQARQATPAPPAPAPPPAPVPRVTAPPAPPPAVPLARPLPQAAPVVAPARVQPAPLDAAETQVARIATPTITAAPITPLPVTAAPVAAASMPSSAPLVAVSAAMPAPPVRSAPRPAPIPGVSLAETQPLLSALLQQLESGRGDRLINMLDPEARNHPGAQALSRHYDYLVDGMRPVRLSHVEFKAEPADGRLLVIGNIGLQVGDQSPPVSRKMMLRAEFASRDGSVVMIGLSGGRGN